MPITTEPVAPAIAPPVRPNADAQAEGYRRFLADLLTEPLSERQTADLFDVSRPVAKRLLQTIPGVERVEAGRAVRWRIPLRSCPPAYVAALELPKRTNSDQ